MVYGIFAGRIPFTFTLSPTEGSILQIEIISFAGIANGRIVGTGSGQSSYCLEILGHLGNAGGEGKRRGRNHILHFIFLVGANYFHEATRKVVITWRHNFSIVCISSLVHKFVSTVPLQGNYDGIKLRRGKQIINFKIKSQTNQIRNRHWQCFYSNHI